MGSDTSIMNPTVTVDETPLNGVRLIAPTAPGFDARVQALIPSFATIALQLQPVLVIVDNASPHTVVAYTIRFDFYWGTSSKTDYLQSKFPDAVANSRLSWAPFGRGLELHPGEAAVMADTFQIEPDAKNQWLSDYVKALQKDLHGRTKLTIQLDAVLLDNGELSGTDSSGLAEAFTTFLVAKQALYRSVLDALARDHDTTSVLTRLKTEMANTTITPKSIDRQMAIQQLLSWIHRHPQADVRSVLQTALLAAPFNPYHY
jgi:hypothetical protein